MSITRTSISFQIVLNDARAFGGHEEIMFDADFRAWMGIADAYTDISLLLPDMKQVEIHVDWSSAVAYALKRKELYARPKKEVDRVLLNEPDFFEPAIICLAIVKMKTEYVDLLRCHGDRYLQYLLHEIYLVANLCSPGCFSLYCSYIKVAGLDPVKNPFAQIEFGLSEYLFEEAWHKAQETNWIKVGFLPFNNVFQWYQRLQLGFRYVARSSTEKALFALLHLGRASFLEPEATLWLASALEAVFDTPHGSSFQFLKKRISTFLCLDERQQVTMKKGLREFYDVRNSFAHGGGAICHPMADEFLDLGVDEVSDRTVKANNFACGILLSCIQELIRRNITGLEFKEQLVEVEFEEEC